ncbi:MAG: TonB C-terminal domain-containing protein [Burkholderiales bacterium]|nr:TonB C-terminal domain-containing protein [Burkholderiales bacterium]
MQLSAAGMAAGAAPSPRLNRALLFSLLIHALLLSLTFGAGRGLPGLDLPWAHWNEAPELRVVLGPEPRPAEPPSPSGKAEPSVDAAAVPAPVHADKPTPLKMLSGERSDDVPPMPISAPPRLTAERPDAAWAVAAASAVPTAVVSTMTAASSPGVQALRQSADALRPRNDREARERAAELARLDADRQDAKDVPTSAIAAFASASSPALEPLRRSAADALRAPVDRGARERATELAQLDGARQQAQQGALRLEAARQEAVRAEAASAEAERQDAARQAAAKQEAARQEAARQEATRGEAGRQEAARQEAARLELGRIEAARLAQAQAEAEQREARLRAIGRQLDEERAKRDAARDAERQRPDWVPARRGRLFGRTDANEALAQYGELWARKIQFNQTFDMVREAARQAYTDPIVTVAVRSDGSVESITFVRSSGVPALDDAVRRVVMSQEHYPVFSPALLNDYDVVEIRRTWHFDMAIRLN